MLTTFQIKFAEIYKAGTGLGRKLYPVIIWRKKFAKQSCSSELFVELLMYNLIALYYLYSCCYL